MRITTLLFLLFVICSSLSAEWVVLTELIAPGTRSEGKRGVLSFNKEKITPYAERIVTRDGREFIFIEPKYTWSDAGWKQARTTPPKAPDTGETVITPEELESGLYYGDVNSVKSGTPPAWVFLENHLYTVWIRPDRINAFLGLTKESGAVPFEFLSDKRPNMLWNISFFPTSLLLSTAEDFLVAGFEREQSQPMIYRISKAHGAILSRHPLPAGFDQTKMLPSFAIDEKNLYYFTGAMKTGKFNIYDLETEKKTFERQIYFTHKSPVISHGERLFLAYSEADHKFCHLEACSRNGERIWHFRTRESICELQPLVDDLRVIYFTSGAIYCFSNN
ncbi:MAG: hypothetical protein PHQ23_12120 [Candidatus Wallbacteria bacterium]|nr:hypothetical protein [Candidatus Wallbacteria bacterium]